MTIIIYTLSDPTTKEVKYIGQTFGTLKDRLSGHLTMNSNTEKHKWMLSLKEKNLAPVIEEIDRLNSEEEANYFEAYWIHQFLIWGFNLFNKVYNFRISQNWVYKSLNKPKNNYLTLFDENGFISTLFLKVKGSYGNNWILPNCETSKKLLSLTKGKSFKPMQVEQMKKIGYSIIL